MEYSVLTVYQMPFLAVRNGGKEESVGNGIPVRKPIDVEIQVLFKGPYDSHYISRLSWNRDHEKPLMLNVKKK